MPVSIQIVDNDQHLVSAQIAAHFLGDLGWNRVPNMVSYRDQERCQGRRGINRPELVTREPVALVRSRVNSRTR